MITHDSNGDVANTLKGFPVESGWPFKLILVTHDESTFYENDCWKSKWSHKSDKAEPQCKGEGQSLMVSDFLTMEWGRLVDGDEYDAQN